MVSGFKRRVESKLRALLVLSAMLFGLLLGANAAASTTASPADAPNITAKYVDLPQLPEHYEATDLRWLHLAYPKALEQWVQPLAGEAQSFREIARRRLGQPVLANVHVRLAEDPKAMTQLAPKNAPYPEYAAGVAYSRLGLVLLTDEPVNPSDTHDLRTTFRHELAHVALYDAIQGRHVPRWFNEGLAVHLSGENSFARMRALATASIAGNVIPLAELERRFPNDIVGVPLAYAQSADVVRYLLRTQDQERFKQLIERLRSGQEFDKALYDSYGMDAYNLEREWLESLESRFSFWPVLFSGTMVWTLAVVLVTLAWRRKRQRQNATLRRWAREEAIEDMRLLSFLQAQPQATSSKPNWETPEADAERLAGSLSQQAASQSSGRPRLDSPLPKVEHDGDWHTLH
jgi:hypothetical protein